MFKDEISIETMRAIVERTADKSKIVFGNGSVIETVKTHDAIRGKGIGIWEAIDKKRSEYND